LHFKLLNAIGRAAAQLQLPADNELSAAKFHHDLFMSGIERIIAVRRMSYNTDWMLIIAYLLQGSRKASTVYYPTLHLEIGRYIQLVRESGMELPYGLQRMIGLPPITMCKPGYDAPISKPKGTPVKSGTNGREVSHTRGASAAAIMSSGATPTKIGGGGYQGHVPNLPKGAGPPVLPAPQF